MSLSRLPEPSLALEPVLDCLEAIALSISQTQSIDDILNTAVREAHKILQTDRVLICRFQPDGSGVVINESVSSSWMPVLNQTIDENSFTSNKVEALRPDSFSAIADIYASDIQPDYLELLAQFQVRANLVVPIVENTPTQKPLWGLLIAHHCSEPRQWQPLEVKLLQQIAMQIAIAIGQTKAFEQFQTELAQRQEAEQELRRQQEFLHHVIDISPNLICVKDWEGKFKLVNQSLANIYETTVEDLVGKTDADFNSHVAEVEHYLQDDREVMSLLQPKFIPEEILTSPSGAVHYLQTIKKPLLSPTGRARYVLATAIDITVRKRTEQERDREAAEKHRLFEQIERQNQTLEAKVQERTAQLSLANEQLKQEVAERTQVQEALQESEQKFRQLAENIQSVFWMSNLTMSQIDYISPAYEKIWGRSCAELYALPKSWLDAVHPEDRDRVIAMLTRIREDDYEQEYRIIRPDGEIRWIRDRSFPIRDEAGHVYRVVGIAEDISDAYQQAEQRKRAEEALQESNERIFNILESITSAFFALNQDGQFTYLNCRAEQFLQETREELLGKNIWDEFPQLVDSRFYKEYHKAISARVTITFEDFYEPLNTWFEIHAYPGHDGLGVYFRNINKRKRAEKALRESEARFRRLFDSNVVGIIFADFRGAITEANDLFLQMVGYTREDLLQGKVRWDEMTPPEYRYLDTLAMEQSKESGVGTPWEKEFIRQDGSRVPVLIGGALLDGVDDQAVAFVLDISDRKRVEEDLRKSEERWQLVLKGNNDGIWDLNLKTNQVFRSTRYKEMLGYQEHELGDNNDDWKTRIHPDDFERVMQINQDYLERKIPHYAVEYRQRCKNGNYKWVFGRAQAVWDAAGSPVRMVGSTTDISDRKQAEEALRESEQQFRQIFQEAPIGISVADFQTHRFLKANPAWCQLLGYSASELLSLTFDEISHPDDLPEDLHKVKQIEQGKIDSFRMEKRYRQKNGEFMWANLTVTVLPSQEGKPKLNLAMIEDITERRQLQTDLLHSEERFRTSVENMLDCFGIYSAIRDHRGQIVDFLIEYVNPATCTFNRTSKEDHIGKRLCELLPSHRETGLFDEYCQLVETGQPLVKESLLFEDTINGQPISGAFDLRAVKLGDGMAVAWRDITERKQAEDQIKASLLEKETLLKEIHHRVKNNLQIISSLLRLQSRQIRAQQTLGLFKESQNRVQAMALIHEKLYQSSNLAQIDFQDYITSLVGNLCRSYDTRRHDVTFKINVEPVSLAIDTAIPCGLIINELVTNSLKYAFPENQAGEICISLQFGESPLNAPLDRENFILTIRDNGIGLPQDFDFRNTSSLGLQLMCRLAKQIGGSLQHNRSQGTEFKIVFTKPISN
ncbi:PAS domain S-box protein [Allocoleopsis sp.]|uniref:PAS domain S-box protein n=1 Tax=Allocoleopsis sp. TaxID=3088169 RepID=UPI002FCF5345